MRLTATALALMLVYMGVAFDDAMDRGEAMQQEAAALARAQEQAIADERWRFCRGAFPGALAQQQWCYSQL